MSTHAMFSVLSLLLISAVSYTEQKSAYDFIKDDPQFKEFYNRLGKNSLAVVRLQNYPATVFIPTNKALRKLDQSEKLHIDYHILNHMIKVGKLIRLSTVTTTLSGNPLLYITTKLRNGRRDFFVNNARIIRSNILAQSGAFKQIIHVVDEVLQPTVSESGLFPTAFTLLANSFAFSRIRKYETNAIYSTIKSLRAEQLFNNTDHMSTYFIPLPPIPSESRLDLSVLKGHVIPNHVLFTRTAGERLYTTTPLSSNQNITIRMRAETVDGTVTYNVISHNSRADKLLKRGSVVSRIVLANIPVRNGVVHFISSQLVVNYKNLFDFLQDNKDSLVKKFYNLIQENNWFLKSLYNNQPFTLFIPANVAFEKIDSARLKKLKANKRQLNEVLNSHIIRGMKLNLYSVEKPNYNGIYRLNTKSKMLYLYARRTKSTSEDDVYRPQLYVSAENTNSTALISDIITSNAAVYVVDQILGLIYDAIGTRISKHYQLGLTSHLANVSRFTSLVNRDEKFTLFAPSDEAWLSIRARMPLIYRTLFRGDSIVQTKKILDRHLIRGKAYRLNQLVQVSNETGINTLQGHLFVEAMDKTYTLKWRHMQAVISQPAIECTNGYIHIIDKVLFDKKEIDTSSAASSVALCTSLKFALVTTILLMLRL